MARRRMRPASERHAAYSGTRNIYGDMLASAKSLVANSSVDVIHMLVEDADMGEELPPLVVVHDVSGQGFFPPDGPNMTSQFTYMAMMRAALCHVLPDVRRVLSLDADTIFRADADGIWDLSTDGCYFAATPEWHRSNDGMLYCNLGVALYDLDALRDGKADEVIDVLNRRRYTWVEQDVFNYLCQGRIAEMPSDYNSNWWTDRNAPGTTVKHFAGMTRAEWAHLPEVERWRGMPWDEVMALREARDKR